MRIKAYSLITIVTLVLLIVAGTGAESTSSQEYQVKAAFLVNFIQFIDWPEEKMSGSKGEIFLGIVGADPFGNAFEPIKDKKVKNMTLVIKRFESFEKLKTSAEKDKPDSDQNIEKLRKCHLVFISHSEEKNLKEIIDTVKDSNVLTVGEMENFLENGGIIKWFVEEKKIRFDINAAAAEQSKLDIRSNLMRLAKKVVGGDVAKKP